MAQFKTVEDVKQAFLVRSNGSDSISNHAGIRYSDIDKHAHIVERLLDTDYNHVSVSHSLKSWKLFQLLLLTTIHQNM